LESGTETAKFHGMTVTCDLMEAETLAVIDFETTGISPAMGDRATEIAVVLIRSGEIVGRYQSLMNAGVYVSGFIEQLTGDQQCHGAECAASGRGDGGGGRFYW
jgi:DNA polymerase III epsilon subunit-like protein